MRGRGELFDRMIVKVCVSVRARFRAIPTRRNMEGLVEKLLGSVIILNMFACFNISICIRTFSTEICFGTTLILDLGQR